MNVINEIMYYIVYIVLVFIFIYYIYGLYTDAMYQPILVAEPTDDSSVISGDLMRKSFENNEYAFSVWIFINSDTYNYVASDELITIFNKSETNDSGNPGVYISSERNIFEIHFDDNVYKFAANNGTPDGPRNIIPIDTWFHLVVTRKDTDVNVYLNGNSYTQNALSSKDVSLSTGENLYINPSGDFKGKITNLQYFNSNLNDYQVENLYDKGYELDVFDVLNNVIVTNIFGTKPVIKRKPKITSKCGGRVYGKKCKF